MWTATLVFKNCSWASGSITSHKSPLLTALRTSSGEVILHTQTYAWFEKISLVLFLLPTSNHLYISHILLFVLSEEHIVCVYCKIYDPKQNSNN